jgi:hypothetical protein
MYIAATSGVLYPVPSTPQTLIGSGVHTAGSGVYMYSTNPAQVCIYTVTPQMAGGPYSLLLNNHLVSN